MELLDIAGIRAYADQHPVAPTKEVPLPNGQTVIIALMSIGVKADIAGLATARERVTAMLRYSIVAPRVTDADVEMLVTNAALQPISEAIVTAINAFNQTDKKAEGLVKDAHFAFRYGAGEPEAPASTGPLPL